MQEMKGMRRWFSASRLLRRNFQFKDTTSFEAQWSDDVCHIRVTSLVSEISSAGDRQRNLRTSKYTRTTDNTRSIYRTAIST
jgi:hypothetical protein